MSPISLSFILGLAAALARSDLSVPEAAAKALSHYLLFAIGMITGEKRLAAISSFIVVPFKKCALAVPVRHRSGRGPGVARTARRAWDRRIGFGILMPLERCLTEAFTNAGVMGFTVLPVFGGAGRSGLTGLMRCLKRLLPWSKPISARSV